MDQTARTNWTKLAILSACAIVPLFGTGCEDAQTRADRLVQNRIYEAKLVAYEENGADRAVQLLQEATQIQEAGPAAKADAWLRMAQIDYARAVAQLPALNDREAKVTQIMEDIARLGRRLAENNQLIDVYSAQIKVYRGNDPEAQGELQKALQKSRSEAAALVSELNKKIADTQKSIQAKSTEITKLQSSLAELTSQADALLLRSEQAKGQEAVDVYKQALAARARASNIAHAAANAKTDLARLEQSLAELRQQKTLAQEGTAAARNLIASLNKAAEDLDKARQARVSVGKGIATQGIDLVPGGQIREPGIEGKAKELAAALAAADELRQQVDAALNAAIENYDAASRSANQAWVEIDQRLRELPNESPSRPALEEQRRLYSPLAYDVSKARVLQARGRIYASQKDLLQAKQRLVQMLTPVFRDAKFQLPAELSPQGLAKQTQEATKVAQECFAQAEEIYKDAMDRGEPNERAAAQLPRIGVQYALYTLTGKDQYLTAARAQFKEMAALTDGADDAEAKVPAKVLPVLPLELEQGIINRDGGASPTPPPQTPDENAMPPGNP